MTFAFCSTEMLAPEFVLLTGRSFHAPCGSPSGRMLVHWDDVGAQTRAAGEIAADWQDLGSAAGSRELGLRRVRIHPGRRGMTVHRHHAEEELFYVLGGTGLVWRAGVTHEVRAGDVLLEPAAGPAHALIAGEDGLDVLAFGPRLTAEVGEVPRPGLVRVGLAFLEGG